MYHVNYSRIIASMNSRPVTLTTVVYLHNSTARFPFWTNVKWLFSLLKFSLTPTTHYHNNMTPILQHYCYIVGVESIAAIKTLSFTPGFSFNYKSLMRNTSILRTLFLYKVYTHICIVETVVSYPFLLKTSRSKRQKVLFIATCVQSKVCNSTNLEEKNGIVSLTHIFL